MKRCILCDRVMNDTSTGTEPPHYVCPTCGYEDIYGPYKLTDPEDTRAIGDRFYDLADELEARQINEH